MELSIKILNKFFKEVKERKFKILVAYTIFLTSFILFLAFDQVSKTLLFEHGSVNEGEYIGQDLFVRLFNGKKVLAESIYPSDPNNWVNYKIIGIRSIWHGGVTFLKTRNQTFIQGLSIIFLIILPISLIFKQKHYKISAFLIGLVLAGTSGNMIDRFVFNGHVKDIVFLPFIKDRGTFNIADAEIMLGILLFVIYSFSQSLFKKKPSNIQHLVV
ncbi:signal peptidase [Mycoplasmopsis canis]|uniref:signal peptidase II n=1 Tax=Mycoplasmopsis canis TaxID=29555 RepID=UPI000624DCBB|nr:signal peptidase II [Mycoplasmopsis canis]AKF41112.1 signal peptidase [Mycoplasmopsis canis]WQQ12179.1 signal peptidase II [Mycoplasmopsis canis]